METTGITSDTPYSFSPSGRIRCSTGRVCSHQGHGRGIVCNLYVEPVSQTVFCVMTNGCKTTREDGIAAHHQKALRGRGEVFLPEAD